MMPDSQPQPTPSGFFKLVAKSIPTLLVLGIMAAGWLAVHEINTNGDPQADEAAGVVDASATDTVTLPKGKLSAGGFKSARAEPQEVQHVHVVSGRIRYDESRHVDVKAPIDGIVTEVLVTPGQQVECEQLLAVIRSPQIGQARAEIQKRQKQKEIAKQILDREQTLSQNLEELFEMLDQRRPISTIEAAFAERSLGAYRQDLFSAYVKQRLASELVQNVQPLAESGSISGRTVREREAERQIAEAAFRTARDQASFVALQGKLQTEADLAEADRQLDLAWQSLEILLGFKVQEKGGEAIDSVDSLSRLEIRAPFAGSIESRSFANNERVNQGDSLMVLANTRSLYVAANIRESDWPAVALQQGTQVSVSVPALGNRSIDARVHYVGREVAVETNAVPLVATIDNSEGLLRPGMYVRVAVPVGEKRDVLSVKPESVVQHENRQFVFVAMSGGSFKRVDIATGLVSDDWIEVTKGLSAGQLVVTEGAFLLKSEMLLEGESE
jgi:cobalt-zinc-cadmium efflux system membrane fusion protein